MPYTVVQFTLPVAIGDVCHRMTWPMQTLAGDGSEFRVIHVDHLSPYRYQLAMDADLLVICMVWDLDLFPILRWRRARGKPTVFEVNDYIFELHPWNPGFDNWNDPATQGECLNLMTLADLVQTSTPFLAKSFEPHAPRVAVFANYLFDAPAALPPKEKRPLVVGWAGSQGHFDDVARIAPAISKWITEHEDVELRIMGDPTFGRLFTVPPGRLRQTPWGEMDAYQEFLRGVHIGLAPLLDTPYNRGRSDAKWLEYAANGCVFVGGRLAPYADSVKAGKTGFLFSDNEELLRILDRLHADRRLAESVRRAAFDHVTRHRRHENHRAARADAYRELLTQSRPHAGESSNLHEIAGFPRVKLPDPLPAYIMVGLAPDERAALREMYADRADVPEALIGFVEQRFGEYHTTQYSRGAAALARGDMAEAEHRLRRSLSFYPAAVRSLTLLGQALLAMRRPHEAREALSQATGCNPDYFFTYPHLVAANEMLTDWQAAIAVTETWEKRWSRDPRAPLRRGLIFLAAGRGTEGMALMNEALARFKADMGYWQLPFGADMVRMIRQAEPTASLYPDWPDLILKAAETFPCSLWLASRAGEFCYLRGEYERGARILQEARERLRSWEYLIRESLGSPQEYRRAIEAYRMACEGLT